MFGQGRVMYRGINLYLRVNKRVLGMFGNVRLCRRKLYIIFVCPRCCNILGNLSLPKGCETGTRDVPEGKRLEVYSKEVVCDSDNSHRQCSISSTGPPSINDCKNPSDPDINSLD